MAGNIIGADKAAVIKAKSFKVCIVESVNWK
jgi:hypothetical protein